jgi:hypothetical protein
MRLLTPEKGGRTCAAGAPFSGNETITASRIVQRDSLRRHCDVQRAEQVTHACENTVYARRLCILTVM